MKARLVLQNEAGDIITFDLDLRLDDAVGTYRGANPLVLDFKLVGLQWLPGKSSMTKGVELNIRGEEV